MTKKGELKEWISRIIHGTENPRDFTIIFRDFDEFIEIPFYEFIERQKENNIPLHRISQIRKKNIPVYTRPNFCKKCGTPLHTNECLHY